MAKIIISKEKILQSINETDSMSEACQNHGINIRTFTRIAKEYGLYNPVKGKNGGGIKFSLRDILAGKHPQYSTSHLSKRLVSEGIKKYECETCGIYEWNDLPISLELNHKDGNNGNHSLDNLELICPNCHSQTPTYRSKKLKLK